MELMIHFSNNQLVKTKMTLYYKIVPSKVTVPLKII